MHAPSQFASLSSRAEDPQAAVREIVQASESLAWKPQLAFLFAAEIPDDSLAALATAWQSLYPDAVLVGCGCQGTIAGSNEWEEGASISLLALAWPEIEIRPFHLSFRRTPEGNAFAGSGQPIDLSEWDPAQSVLICLADPYTFPMDLYLDRVREEAPRLGVVGGMASGGHGPGTSRLLMGGQWVNHGAVLVGLRNLQTQGWPRFAHLVSQGCRPVGQPLIVTAAERNEVFQLGGRPAVDQLMRIYRELPTTEQRQLQQGLHLGIAVDEFRERFGLGDFLIRNVTAIDQDSQTIGLGDSVRVGQTVQFHLRDHLSATADLKHRLQRVIAEYQPRPIRSGLVFSCNGRGQNLFPQPDHDAGWIRNLAGEIPLAGFFAAGEIGPVGGVNFVHGFTASCLFFFD